MIRSVVLCLNLEYVFGALTVKCAYGALCLGGLGWFCHMKNEGAVRAFVCVCACIYGVRCCVVCVARVHWIRGGILSPHRAPPPPATWTRTTTQPGWSARAPRRPDGSGCASWGTAITWKAAPPSSTDRPWCAGPITADPTTSLSPATALPFVPLSGLPSLLPPSPPSLLYGAEAALTPNVLLPCNSGLAKNFFWRSMLW